VYAATGGKFILGKTNKANKVSTLKRTTSGSALNLVTKSSSNAPLTTNGRGKVTNLNADKVDGYDAAALQTQTYSWTKSATAVTSVSVDLPALPPGTYLIGYDAYMPGGGLDASSAGCWFWRTRPSASNTFYAETRELTKTGTTPSLSGASVVALAAGDVLHLYCSAPAAFTTSALEPIHIYAARTASAGGGALRIAPGSRTGR
jgi:hypothetical protein